MVQLAVAVGSMGGRLATFQDVGRSRREKSKRQINMALREFVVRGTQANTRFFPKHLLVSAQGLQGICLAPGSLTMTDVLIQMGGRGGASSRAEKVIATVTTITER
mmetsp:Transcript_32697/g.73389  ORF Transcript_32697/g.73389 Transcript_32697/m.73389 type:complete len:106 (-) Transcript_32697:76-393(-)